MAKRQAIRGSFYGSYQERIKTQKVFLYPILTRDATNPHNSCTISGQLYTAELGTFDLEPLALSGLAEDEVNFVYYDPVQSSSTFTVTDVAAEAFVPSVERILLGYVVAAASGGHLHFELSNCIAELSGDHFVDQSIPGSKLKIDSINDIPNADTHALGTATLIIEDAGTAGATEAGWVEVSIGGTTVYLRGYASK